MMALLPTIPTSFVPQSNVTSRRFSADLVGAFGFFAYGVLGIVFLLALGVFLYGHILASDLSAKRKEIAKYDSDIKQETVRTFVRLSNRLTSSNTLLTKHIAFSTFFSSLEEIIPTTVRFTAIHLSSDSAGLTKIEGTGIAKSFNALASASAKFADDGRIKDAIFSNININKDSSVSFALVATLDPSIVVFSPNATAPNTSSASTTSSL